MQGVRPARHRENDTKKIEAHKKTVPEAVLRGMRPLEEATTKNA